MSIRTEDCRGIWAPVVTPFRDDAVDRTALAEIVDALIRKGLQGLLALGTTGEAAHLTEDEAAAVVRTVCEAAAGRVPVLAGSGRQSTASTIAAGKRLAQAGAGGLLVLTPHVYRHQLDAAALRRHYAAVAAEAPVPVFVYHMPGVTALDLAADTLIDLAGLPNILGFKDSATTGGPLAATLARVATRGFVGAGSRLVEGLAAGACGGILAVAQVAPALCLDIDRSWAAGDRARAEALQERLTSLVRALASWGVPGIKAALELQGLPAGSPRRPLASVPFEMRSAIARALEAVT